MAGEGAVADPHLGDFREGGLQSSHQLCFQLGVDHISLIVLGNVPCYIGIEQNRIHQMIGILSVTADRNINVQADVVIHYAEGYRIGCSVFIPGNFLRIDIIYSLIVGRISAEGYPSADFLKGI